MRNTTRPTTLRAAFATVAACLIACASPAFAETAQKKTPAELLERAQAGDKDAQFEYGDLLMFREDTPPDEAGALIWYRKAADQGNARAQYMLGQMSLSDPSKPYYMGNAIYWFGLAAAADYRLAQYELGGLLVGMSGVTYHYPDAEEGMMWLHKAAAKGFVAAELKLATLYGHDDNGLRIQVVARDEAEAVKWYRAAAEHGSGNAMYALALRYRDGRGMAQDRTEAVRWAQRIENGEMKGEMDAYAFAGALTLLGAALVEDGDYEKARLLLSLAAKRDNAEAQFRLSEIYAQGLGVAKDTKKAAELRQKAENNGYSPDTSDEPDIEDARNLKTMFADGKMAAKTKARSDAMRQRE
jgi:uncharacterized protein